jgi:hypothetical protein
VLGAAAFFLLTDWPGEATWLDPEQSSGLQRELHEQKNVGGQAITVWQAFKSCTIRSL